MPTTEIKGFADETTRANLEYLSRVADRAPEDLVTEAVAEYVAYEAYKMRKIERGLADAEAGNFASEEEVDAFFDDWIKNG